MPATSVPGYVQGFRFNAANYTAPYFADLSGNGGDMKVITGAPTFETVDGYEGVLLDNTMHATFWHPNAWQGTIVTVMRSHRLTSGTHERRLIDFANDGWGGTAGRLSFVHAGGNSVRYISEGALNVGNQTFPPNNIGAFAACLDQERRQGFSTKDGVTVSSTGVQSGTTDGEKLAMQSNPEGAYFGTMQGSSTNTTPETGIQFHFFELHFFEANPIEDAPTEMQAFLAELEAAYA